MIFTSVRRLVIERFKAKAPAIPRIVTVETTVTTILKNDPDRFSWIIFNLSVNRGYMWFDREVSPTHGIPIEAQGGFVSASWEEDGELPTYALFGINQVAAGNWSVVESTTG